MRRLFTLVLIFIFYQIGLSQNSLSLGGSQLIESKWRYAYMLHLESGTVLHKAEDDYSYYLYFRSDYTYQQMLNGQFSQGVWSYSIDNLQYRFKDILEFTIVQVNEEHLVLEFTRANSRGHFQYHYVNAFDNHPFPKPKNELPLVVVKEKKLFSFPWWFPKSKDKKAALKTSNEPVFINIELVGGGYYGGVDPVLRDIIHIKTDGRLIKEYQTKNKGLVVTKKNIPRAELERFCEFVVAQKYFKFDREYDCNTELCEHRKRQKPNPIPLRIAITYGSYKKVVTVAIWGTDEQRIRYVQYPPSLDNIIDAIQRFALRIEP